jgi:hypothetical protein
MTDWKNTVSRKSWNISDVLGGDCGSRWKPQAGEEPEGFFDIRVVRRVLYKIFSSSTFEELCVFFSSS